MKRLLSVFALSVVLLTVGCGDETKNEKVKIVGVYDFSTVQNFTASIAAQGRKEINPMSTATPRKGSFSAAQSKEIVFRYISAVQREHSSEYEEAIAGISGDKQAADVFKLLDGNLDYKKEMTGFFANEQKKLAEKYLEEKSDYEKAIANISEEERKTADMKFEKEKLEYEKEMAELFRKELEMDASLKFVEKYLQGKSMVEMQSALPKDAGK